MFICAYIQCRERIPFLKHFAQNWATEAIIIQTLLVQSKEAKQKQELLDEVLDDEAVECFLTKARTYVAERKEEQKNFKEQKRVQAKASVKSVSFLPTLYCRSFDCFHAYTE